MEQAASSFTVGESEILGVRASILRFCFLPALVRSDTREK